MTATAEIESGGQPAKPAPKKCNKALWGLLGFIACAGGTIGGVMGGIFGSQRFIVGTWASNFGSHATITKTHWYSYASWGQSASEIHTFTNSYVIFQTSADATYNPSKWNKIEYHEMADGKWGYCTSVYDADSAQAAIDSDTTEVYKSADATTGCNGFPHTEMSPYAMPIAGTWSTNFGATLTISATEWKSEASYGNSAYTIEAYGANYVLMQNPADDEFNPSKWTKVQFHTVGDGFGYCMSVYNGETSIAALTTDTSSIYTATNATAGCNGFSHTIASPA